MRKWKQTGAFVLAAVLAFSGPASTAWAGSPEFARTSEEWEKLRDNVMEYGELKDLIHEYNVTVKKNQIDINDKKKDDRVTSDEYADYYRDAADSARSNIAGDDPVADANNSVAARKAEEQADRNVEDLTVYQLTYDQEEANLVATAKNSMISYFQQKYELETLKDNLELLQALYQSVQVKQGAGLVTQTDVLDALQKVQDTQSSIEKQTASIEQTRQKLCIMLGWKYNDSPEIRNIPEVDMAQIEAMNPDADRENALNNNYTLKINKQKLANATADVTKDTLNRTIASNEQNISTDLVKSYQEVLQAKAAYDQSVTEFNLESKNMEAAERKVSVGSMSQLDYRKQKNAFITKSNGVHTAQLALFQSVQTYHNAVNGLASTGG
ncbi:TolC family protein [Clostridium boliviensis]|uniref:TolC family protein n=1 Tax=Clostridium boliviensis TaxID=318465 RepID=A0ABU4GQS0_9CLOT|nr:TolC family protein [Clostridium boliviensis]MDW2798552.1 TolC family protein [Clostridium boliviensis]